jgi:spermidine synthase
MKKFEKLEDTPAVDGSVLSLYRHDDNYSIRAHGLELMSTRRHHSEDMLAELVCAPLRTVQYARVLIGGLGFGFTLRAALRTLGPDAEIVVVEPVAGIVRWNENASYDLAHTALRDLRVIMRQNDVAATLASSPASYDAIIMEVDALDHVNATGGNARFSRETAIHLAASALRLHGELAFWSAAADADFAESLRRCGLDVRTVDARAHITSGPRHFIYVANSTR